MAIWKEQQGPKLNAARSQMKASVIRFAPLIWLSGATPVAYQVLSAWPLLSGSGKMRGLSRIQLILIIYCLIYGISIAVAALGGAEIVRVVAATYNLSIWVLGAVVFSTTGNEDPEGVRKASRLLLVILAAISVIAYVLFSGAGSVRFNSFLGYFISSEKLPENLAANTNLYITSADWSTLGLGSRLSIMAPYPTALGMLALVLIGLASPARWDRRNLVRFLPYIAIGLLLSYLCASRAAMGSMLLYICAFSGFYAARSSRSSEFKVFLVTAFLFIALLSALAFGDQVASAWNTVNATRADSSSLRFELYSLSIKSALESHPILGFGVKERISTYAIPLGSHSTLFGAMYKTGIIGFLTVAALFLYTGFWAVKTGFGGSSLYRAGVAAGCLAMLPLLFFEDIDAIPLVAYLFFCSLAIMERPGLPMDDRAE